MTVPVPLADPRLVILPGAGLVGGLALLWQGFAGYRRAGRIRDTGTSAIRSIAVGEVRVSGVVEAAELGLVSPLQSEPCVYYRSFVTQDEGRTTATVFREERSVGFRVRDETGVVRVFPHGARFDIPVVFDDHDGLMGDRPVGLEPRSGGSFRSGVEDRASEIAALLTVHPGLGSGGLPDGVSAGPGGRRHYREARLEIGASVTIVGTALPFDQLADPTGADEGGATGVDAGDAEVAADLAAARAAGTLAPDATSAWGNAAIPGFGIGHPEREPTLDPAATPEPVTTATEADPGSGGNAARSAERLFDIAPDALILAATEGSPLLIAAGTPGSAEARGDRQFLLGLAGAILAIASAVALAIMLGGGIG